MEDRGLNGLGHVGAVRRRARVLRRGGETDLVVDDDVHRAADAVAGDIAHGETLGDDALTGEGRITVDEDGEHGVRQRRVDLVLTGTDDAHHDRVHGLEVARVGREFDSDVRALRGHVLAGGTKVVLHVAGTLEQVRSEVALELTEDLVVALPDDVREHVETTTVGHADDGALEVLLGGRGQDAVEHRDGGLAALEAEPLGANVLGGEEPLVRVGRREALGEPALFVTRELGGYTLETGLDPLLLVQIMDVHVLNADRAAVGVAEHLEQFPQLHPVLAGNTADEKLTLEVPDAQPIVLRIHLVEQARFFPAQRVEVGHEVPTDAVRADKARDRHLLAQHGFFAVDGAGVDTPAHRLVGHSEAAEDEVVEAVLADEVLVQPLEEHAALGALDNAVVIRARDSDDLRHAELHERAHVCALELGRVVDGSDTDDDALTGHQARNRLNGADGSRVGEADGCASKVGHRQLVRLGLADQRVVGIEELDEAQGLRVSQHGHHECARPITLVHVDSESHVDRRAPDEQRLAVGALGKPVVHVGHGISDGADDGKRNDVGEADLAQTDARAVRVNALTVHLEQARRDVAETRRRRDLEAPRHVCGNGGRRAADRFTLGGCHRSGRCRDGCCGRRSCGGGCHRSGRARCEGCRGSGCNRQHVGLEECAPGVAYRVGVCEVLGSKLVDEPSVRAELFLFNGHPVTLPIPVRPGEAPEAAMGCPETPPPGNPP
uniref:Unannotated protein n=1 Tax=freshwater metagenome TaxID=449393 RepID=A0A6J7P5N2_9ZZZZ